jgi:hypothetical protein
MKILAVMCDFALSTANVYFGLSGSGNTALNLAAAVFCFEMGILQTAIYLKEGGKNG